VPTIEAYSSINSIIMSEPAPVSTTYRSRQPLLPDLDVEIRNSRIMIVDDNQNNIYLLERLLRQERFWQLDSTTNSLEALDLVREFKPDILLLDLHMPGLDGMEVMDLVRAETPSEDFFPIVMLTADISTETRLEALSHGATDFLTKPYDHVEAILRIRNLLQTRLMHNRIKKHNAELEGKVRERTADLEFARQEVLMRLARAAEFRDDETGQHTQRVGRNAGILAELIGLDPVECELIEKAAPLHDIGKLGIPDSILLKDGILTPEEFELMKTHTTIGGRILANGKSDVIQLAETIAMTHHEKWAGGGYPNGLVGEEIPIAGRIVAVVDVFDALTHERSYKAAWSFEEALSWLGERQGQAFDPRIVEAFTQGFLENRFLFGQETIADAQTKS
jgi:putative two-component system response regulator